MSIDNTTIVIEHVTNHRIKISGLSNINSNNIIHYLIYKIINLNNGKYYIGQHKTKNPLDEYMGSGHFLKKAIKKEGIDSFVKVILKDYDNFDDMNNKEKELVSVSNCFPQNPNTYNLIEGGNGQLTDNIKQQISETIKKSGICAGKNNPMYGYKWSEEQRKHQSEVMTGRQVSEEFKELCRKRYTGEGNPMFGKNHSKETRMKISETRKSLNISKGENNPMFGLKHMTDKQKEEWKSKISKGNSGKIRTEEFKQKLHNKALQEQRRKMYHPDTNHKICVPLVEIEFYLSKGYLFGVGKVKRTNAQAIVMTGKRKMINDKTDDIKIVDKSEIQKYLNLGYHFSKRSLKELNLNKQDK